MHHVSSGRAQSGVITSGSATISGSRRIESSHFVTTLMTPLSLVPPRILARAPMRDWAETRDPATSRRVGADEEESGTG